jgi:hypothetical protein
VVFIGVTARPAGLQGLCSGLRSLPLESGLPVKGEFAREDGGLDESDGLLSLFAANGNRDEGFVVSRRIDSIHGIDLIICKITMVAIMSR